jgi:site-specific recombinase XerD
LLRPDVQTFDAMLEGWRAQQLARGLNADTIKARAALVRRFQAYTNEFPWSWRPLDVEEFFAEGRSARKWALSTVRGYQDAIRVFCDYVSDPRYDWVAICEERFGDHPAQICFDWNVRVHKEDYEGVPQRRAMTRAELQLFFDFADDEVVRLRHRGHKGWLPAHRDATVFKTAYAFGLRRREVRMLDLEDLGPNPHAPEFGGRGVLYVRFAKANKGGPPRRRSVLTVFGWSTAVLEEWENEFRALLPTSTRSSALWPSERAARVAGEALGRRFTRWRDMAGLPGELTPHCLRHSYVTHLIEDGYDPLFVQQQVGHSHASSTSIYTSVSSDFRTRTLRSILDADLAEALTDLPVKEQL